MCFRDFFAFITALVSVRERRCGATVILSAAKNLLQATPFAALRVTSSALRRRIGFAVLCLVAGMLAFPAAAAPLAAITVCDGAADGAICVPAGASPIARYAAALLQERIGRLSGRRPEVVEGKPAGAVMVLALKSACPCPLTPAEQAGLGDEGYLARVVQSPRGPQMVLVGGSDRGLLYGAARLADLALQAEGRKLTLGTDGAVHAPAMALRGNYTLACWGKTHLYTREHWCHIFDAMAADSMNVVMFWLSGLFPSQKQPASVTYPATKINVEDLRAMIRHAHRRGIRFLLGSGIFAWFGVDGMAKRYPETQAVGSGGMCPSNPLARRLNREYLLEMLDALSEADGFFLEVRDEYGPCECPVCQRRLDEHGSKQYGQAELSFLREFTAEVWRRNPRAIFISTIGYGVESKGAHAGDGLFYEGIRKLQDPRLFWLVCRRNWDLPAAGGGRKPLAYFSANMLQWDQYYRLSTSAIGEWVRRAREAGCRGFCPALEPGFCSGSWYSDDVPYPVDAIPYAVTRFAYREYCWSPALTEKEFRARLLDRFFGPAAPASLADDLVGLFDVIRTQSQNQRLSGRSSTAWSRGCLARALDEADHALRSAGREPVPYARLQELAELVARQGKALGQIEEHLGAAEAQLSARGKETLVLIRRALADTRRELCLEPASAERVRELADRARRVLAERRKSLPAVAEAASEHGPRYAAENVLDGNLDTSWLAKDRALLPQAITITFRKAQKIDYVRLVQGNYHPAYNTQAYRVECSPNGSSFALLWAGELPNRPGAAHVERFAPREALGLRIVVTSVYPNIDYSSPSLAEVDFGLGGRSGLAP